MMRQRARALSTMGQQLFWSAAGLGALCGAAAAVAILGPAAYWTGSQGDVDTAYLLNFLATILPIAMLSGIGVGILSWAATYAAVGILEVRRPEATALHQAAAGAAGSMAGGLLPALVIFPSVLAEEPNFGIIYGLVFGLMALCFILAFGTLLALNRTDVRQRPGT
ncbi:hypothetical protein [Glutamicibacter protophormiae]|uniref:hypothetical protein n=1 Tax=Glutamicibacter protophormiae TaxID=37930 RepID=UPI00195B9B52|nr:hypothetical protein [Glutamicibacter protophormiae]QRQ79693.1 hypothetical protein JQN66_05600 [Glutamicibacter protophormiae]